MVDSPSPLVALEKAIDSAGSQASLAASVGVSTTAVWKMLHKAQRASAEFVLKIEAATGVSRHDLRPDLYPREHGSSLLADANLVDAAS